MRTEADFLGSVAAKCGTCAHLLLTNGEYVICRGCNNKYRFSPCTTVKDNTYMRMTKNQKHDWRCTNCRTKFRLSSADKSGEQQTTPKQRGNNEGDDNDTLTANSNKRRRPDEQETPHTSNIDMKEFKIIIEERGSKIPREIKQEISNTLIKKNEMIGTLSKLVSELTGKNKEKDSKISHLEQRVHRIKQQALDNNIVMSNVTIQEGEYYILAAQNIRKANRYTAEFN